MAYKYLALIAVFCTTVGCGTETMTDHELGETNLILGPNKANGIPTYRTRSNGKEHSNVTQLSPPISMVIGVPDNHDPTQLIQNDDRTSKYDQQKKWLREHHVPHEALNSFINAMEPANTERCQNSRRAVKGNGIPQLTYPTLESFSSVHVSGPILVFARHSNTSRVLIRADGNLVSRVEAETIDGTAVIRLNSSGVCFGIQPVVLLEGPGFGNIEVEGSASLEVFDISRRHVRVSVERFSHLEMHGHVRHLIASARPFANIIASDLSTTNVQVTLDSNAYASVQASKSISGHLNRSSQLSVMDGSANIQTTGGGQITVEPDDTSVRTNSD